HYLERARDAMANSRRSLKKLEGEVSHRKVDQALRFLKRAERQLADPRQVLQQLLADESTLMRQTTLLQRLEGGEIRVQDTAEQVVAPAWLTHQWLDERQ